LPSLLDRPALISRLRLRGRLRVVIARGTRIHLGYLRCLSQITSGQFDGAVRPGSGGRRYSRSLDSPAGAPANAFFRPHLASPSFIRWDRRDSKFARPKCPGLVVHLKPTRNRFYKLLEKVSFSGRPDSNFMLGHMCARKAESSRFKRTWSRLAGPSPDPPRSDLRPSKSTGRRRTSCRAGTAKPQKSKWSSAASRQLASRRAKA
jgi:hypothetical protein